MPESRDKRRRSDLDFFILALIESGLATPYEFQIGAGLSPGATIPALRRLLAGGWVTQSRPGARGRTEHRITAAGRRHLQNSWRQLVVEGPTGDGDADLRVALLSVFVGGNRKIAVEFLRASSKQRKAWLKSVYPGADVRDQPPLAYWYQKLRSDLAVSVVHAEAAGILAMAKRLPEKYNRERRSE